MLPAALGTLVTFLFHVTNSSPVYNMQPAFITTNIGFTSGRNIRNLPCVSRKRSDLSGICMFAIDCIKSNGTHLGTCIDRFYFGSCCHLEPIKEIESNSIETNIILDSREPPHRVHNKTAAIGISSTQSSLSDVTSSITPPSLQNNETNSSSMTVTTPPTMTTSTSSHPTTIISTVMSSPSSTSSPSVRPFGEKLPQNNSENIMSTETTTTAQKLQTFQIVDGSLVEATTSKPVQVQSIKTTSRPSQTTTKSTITTPKTKPPLLTTKKTTKPPTSTSKPDAKPSKPNKPVATRKPTQKPTKPVKVSSTTRRPITTTKSTRKPSTTKPTRKVTRPSINTSSAKPSPTPSERPPVTTDKITKKPALTTKKPLISTTVLSSSTTTKNPLSSTTIESSSTVASSSISTTQLSSINVTETHPIISTNSSTLSTTSTDKEEIMKKNATEISENSTLSPATNEVLESGISTTNTLSPDSITSLPEDSTTSTYSSTSSTMKPLNVATSASTSAPKEPAPQTTVSQTSEATITTGTSTAKPTTNPGTWTIDDPKNHTMVDMDNGTLIIGNITEEWVPITTPDGWVLLPSVAPSTTASGNYNNETLMSSSSSSTSAPVTEDSTVTTFGPVTTFVPLLTVAPVTDLTASGPVSTSTSESMSSSSSSQVTTSSSTSAITSIVTSTSEGEKVTTFSPISTTSVGNGSVVEGEGSGGIIETSSIATSTEYVPEDKPVNMSDFTQVCGRRMWPEARIVGGEKSAFGKWPWQISLRQWRTSTYLHKCGAALLNENWAITAAHCVDNVPPSDLLLRLGEHDLSTEEEAYLHEERRVQIVASHPQFDPRTFEYDLALLRFYEPVVFQPNILPVCVPTKDESFVGRTAYVTGWGRLYEDGPLPSVLQEVSVPVINNTVCESMYRSAGYIEHIPHIFICAGWRRGGFDSCEGDSGGPMVIQREDKRFLLAGVISWGIGCAEPNQPGVYTRISEFRDWINQILQF